MVIHIQPLRDHRVLRARLFSPHYSSDKAILVGLIKSRIRNPESNKSGSKPVLKEGSKRSPSRSIRSESVYVISGRGFSLRATATSYDARCGKRSPGRKKATKSPETVFRA